MMSFQLQKSSLFSLLSDTGMQRAEGRVRSKSLLEEMSLIGFIPYTDYYLHQLVLSSVDLNDHLHVAPYLVRFSKDTPVYPYYKMITKATGKKYKIDEKLYVDPILDEIPSSVLKYAHFKLPLDGNQLLKLMYKKWDKKNLFVENGNGTYEYTGREGEWELSCGLGNMISISNNFLCLCSYMNRVTGTPSFAVLTSDDTIRVLPENELE